MVREQRAHGRDRTSQDLLSIDREPTGEELLIAAELIDELMARMELASHRSILSLALQGYSTQEISPLVRRSERTVLRVLDEVRLAIGAEFVPFS